MADTRNAVLRLTIAILTYLASAKAYGVVSAAMPAESFITELLQSFDRLAEVKLQFKTTTTTASTKGLPNTVAPTIRKPPWPATLVFRRDGNRAFLSNTSGVPTKLRQSEKILIGDVLTSFSCRLNDSYEQINIHNGVIRQTSEQIAGEDHQASLQALFFGLNEQEFLFGYVARVPIAAFFAAPSRFTATRKGAFIEVSSDSPYGHLWMKLDPNYGFLPKDLTLRQVGNDLLGERAIKDIKILNESDTWPSGGIREIQLASKNVVLDKSNDTPFIRQFTLVQKSSCRAGPIVTMTTEGKVDAIEFNPSFTNADFDPTLQFPSGFEVTIDGANHLPYEWTGEEVRAIVVPSIDSGIAPVGKMRALLIVANIVAIIVISFIVIAKKQKAIA